MRVRCYQCGLVSPDERLYRRYHPSVSGTPWFYCPACWKKREERTQRHELYAVLGMLGVIVVGGVLAPDEMGGGLGRLAAMIIVVYSVSVVLHEAGHAVAAWAMGMKVFKVSIGMGALLYSRRFGYTEFELRALPISGFVLPGVHTAQWMRLRDFAVTAGGPAVNIALAIGAYRATGGWPESVGSPGDVRFGHVVAAINLIIAVMNLIPFSFPRDRGVTDTGVQPNDGMLMLLALFAGRRMAQIWLASGLQYEADDLIRRGQLEQALRATSECAGKYPDVPAIGLIHARTMMRLARHDEAEGLLRSLLDEPNTDRWIGAKIASALSECLLADGGAEALDEADRLTSRAVAAAGHDADARLARARVQVRKGWVAEAGKSLSAMLGEGLEEPMLARVACALAEARLAEHDRTEVEHYIALAKTFDPMCPDLSRVETARRDT